jgi:hypothetical protein
MKVPSVLEFLYLGLSDKYVTLLQIFGVDVLEINVKMKAGKLPVLEISVTGCQGCSQYKRPPSVSDVNG